MRHEGDKKIKISRKIPLFGSNHRSWCDQRNLVRECGYEKGAEFPLKLRSKVHQIIFAMTESS